MKTTGYKGKQYAQSWTKNRRKQQCKNCKSAKPWVHSTGPKSEIGKSRSSQNATTHGMRSKVMLDLHRALSQQLNFIRDLEQS
jgi:hypothetical protein